MMPTGSTFAKALCSHDTTAKHNGVYFNDELGAWTVRLRASFVDSNHDVLEFEVFIYLFFGFLFLNIP